MREQDRMEVHLERERVDAWLAAGERYAGRGDYLRAIGCLRVAHHCAAMPGAIPPGEWAEWFREYAGAAEPLLRNLSSASPPMEHSVTTLWRNTNRSREFLATASAIQGGEPFALAVDQTLADMLAGAFADVEAERASGDADTIRKMGTELDDLRLRIEEAERQRDESNRLVEAMAKCLLSATTESDPLWKANRAVARSVISGSLEGSR